MRFVCSIILLVVASVAYSQVSFEKGHFVDNNGQRIECLIKNLDWKNNPSSFEFKIDLASVSQEGSIDQVKEFGIGTDEKWIRASIKVDASSTKKLAYNRQPEWKDRTLFLKVLVEGKASLFRHEEEVFDRFFFSVGNGPIEQLIYKRFLASSTQAAYNKYYLVQLQTQVNCNSSKESVDIAYRAEALTRYFNEYNRCSGSAPTTFKKEKKMTTHWRVTAGVNRSSLTMVNSNGFTAYDVDFGAKTNVRVGIEGEFILPYNKGKWALLLEPTFRSYSGEATAGTSTLVLDYKSIEILGGVRHYFFLNETSRLFLNTAFVFDKPMKAKIDVGPSLSYEITKSVNFSLGFGFQHRKYSAEVRYYSIRNVLSTYPLLPNDFKNYALVWGYRFH